MILPVSQRTYFNSIEERPPPPCEYDMVFHPPDYNPRASRSDRQQPAITRANIWRQEFHKPISSTSGLMYGRPYWKNLERPSKQFARSVSKDDNPHTRIHNVLRWVELLEDGKPLCK